MPEAKEDLQLIPDWAAKILKQAIREYRYTGDNLQGTSDEKLILGIRRGDRPLGTLTLTHVLLQGRIHVIRMLYESADRQTRELLRAQSLDAMRKSGEYMMERICRDGMRVNTKWCEQCPHAERHMALNFRGIDTSPPSPPQAPV